MLTPLIEAAKSGNGVFARNLPGSGGQYRSAAARLLREMGVPLYARKRGADSAWFLLDRSDSALAKDWYRRMIRDHYTEMCRARMALTGNSTPAIVDVYTKAAIALGDLLGYSVEQVLEDVEPTPRAEWVDNMLSRLNNDPS